MNTRLCIAIVTLTVISSLFAAGVGKYRSWPNSPQGYFMTDAERSAWSKLASESDAERFIADFLARRPPTFVDDVHVRKAMNWIIDRAASALLEHFHEMLFFHLYQAFLT